MRQTLFVVLPLDMTPYSDFIFAKPTSFLALPSVAKLSATAAQATKAMATTPTTMYGPAANINPVLEVARIHAKQQLIKNVEMAVFGLLCLCACCMMRRPQPKKQFYADSDDEDDNSSEDS